MMHAVDGPGGRKPRSVGEILPALVRRMRFREKGRFSALSRAWEEVAGPGIAAHSRVGAFLNGRLVIEVDTPVLLHEMKGFLADSLLAALQATGEGRDVAELQFRLGTPAP